jgi:hypothetical protein
MKTREETLRRKGGDMRRGIGMLVIVLVILAGVGIGVGAYQAGVDEGIRRTADASQVVEVVGGFRGGYFPFGFLLFPVLLFGGFALARAAFGHRGGHDHRGPGGHGPWSAGGPWGSDEGRARFEERAAEWHRTQHGDVSNAAGGSPPTA